MLVFFFFSSRRRHTRLQGDWSSDVCSSDLGYTGLEQDAVEAGRQLRVDSVLEGHIQKLHDRIRVSISLRSVSDGRQLRSEERRVGKECRSRGSAEHGKKKEETE